ncbi:MAG: AMP-binding protein [Acidobacteriaceae bacterium]|nr:AMP-binding protein [Acidobacteriaceae bacterium]
MLDLTKYDSLGAALRDALERWPDEVCLIESDRQREKARLTYRDFKDAAAPLAAALQANGFQPGDRAAIIMTNQSKWLISAYAVFSCGGVLVPLDYKLAATEHLQLLAHSHTSVLVIEYYLWRAISAHPAFAHLQTKTVLVTEAPPGAELGGAKRWEEFRCDSVPEFRPRTRKDPACIVYSSGTGGRPKGCVLTHENYLEQCVALTSLYPFWPGVRYLSILPTNHAIDFMVGFIGPFTCGAAVVHLRTLRPEFVRDAFPRYKITYMSLVPMVLKNLERGLKTRFATLPRHKRMLLDAMISINRMLTRRRPHLRLSRMLLPQVHQAFGGELRAMFVGGAFTEPSTLQFFYDLGILVGNGYGLTEAGTAVTLNDFNPFHADTVGKPLPGMEIRIAEPNEDGIGEVLVRSKTVMSHYLDDPEMTAETIIDGWLHTGDVGRIDSMGRLQLFGRKKNMIVTTGGKNIYPEDIETVFEGLPVKEFCIFAADFLWPNEAKLTGEKLVIALRLEPNQQWTDDLRREMVDRNRRLPDFKRVSAYVLWDCDFPRTASLKIKRGELAEQIRSRTSRESALNPL